MTLVLPSGTKLGKPGEVIAHGTADPPLPAAKLPVARLRAAMGLAYSWDDLAAVIELTSRTEPIDLVGPEGYVHGWLKVGAGATDKEPGPWVQRKTANRMTAKELREHLDTEHAGLPAPVGGKQGKALTSKADLLDLHEQMHQAMAETAKTNPAGWKRPVTKSGYLVPWGSGHTHVPSPAPSMFGRKAAGNTTGMANWRPGIELSARTAMLEATPAPRGRPGGPGLYDVRGMGHTDYLQQIVKALIEKRGMDPHVAYAVARGMIRKWARGGGHVHPEVQAASAAAEAGELAKQAQAKASHGH